MVCLHSRNRASRVEFPESLSSAVIWHYGAMRLSAVVSESGGPRMARVDKPKSADEVPLDLLSVIRASGVLGERQLAEIKSKVMRGDYPLDSIALAEALVRDNILTAFQAKRLLSNRPHGLAVGRYIILDRIGSGSMGRVYRAHHVLMDRVVALKIIAPDISANERVVARFQREMKLVGRLDHPNVVRAFDADRINGVLYIVMEFVTGTSLGDRLQKKGPIPAAEMIDYAAQTALGLAHAHDQGIVHRDIKPSNILLNEDRRIKILDLGLGVLWRPTARRHSRPPMALPWGRSITCRRNRRAGAKSMAGAIFTVWAVRCTT